ncbi:MAG: tetratricopeptide repeat protein [Fibrobacter sp.]|nr:tetratricopeptide repeat protein [Fibrobacter sp.]
MKIRLTFAVLLLAASLSLAEENRLVQAYSYYLLQEYHTAKDLYKQETELNPSTKDAWYGIINCHIALQQYRRAVVLSDSLLEVFNEDLTLVSKSFYAKALQAQHGKIKKDYLHWAERFDNDGQLEILNSIAYGYYYSGFYSEALRWFQKMDSLAKANSLVEIDSSIVQMIAALQNLESNFKHWQISQEFGMSVYGENHILDQIGSYSYNNLKFTSIDLSYSRYQKQVFNFFYQGLMVAFNESAFGFQPKNLVAHDFYFSVKNVMPSLSQTSLSAGFAYTISDVYNSKEVIRLFAKNQHFLGKNFVDMGYYLTKSENLFLAQISPLYHRSLGSVFGLGLSGTVIATLDSQDPLLMVKKGTKYGAAFIMDLTLNPVKIESVSEFGSKEFGNYNFGKIFVNSSLNHQFTEKIVTTWQINKAFSLELGGSFELYDELKKLTVFGGYSWKL